MTARIVNMITRHPLQHMMYANPRSADDALVVRTLQGFEPVAGQLWEREAERSVAKDYDEWEANHNSGPWARGYTID